MKFQETMDNNRDDHTEALLEGGDDVEHNHVTLIDTLNPEKRDDTTTTAREMRWSRLCLNFKNEQTALLTQPPVTDAMKVFMIIHAVVVFGFELITFLFFRLPGTLFFHAADVLVQNPETVSITFFDIVATLPYCRHHFDCICAVPRLICLIASLFLFIFEALSLGVGVVVTELLGSVALLVGLCVPLETNSDENCGWLWHQKIRRSHHGIRVLFRRDVTFALLSLFGSGDDDHAADEMETEGTPTSMESGHGAVQRRRAENINAAHGKTDDILIV